LAGVARGIPRSAGTGGGHFANEHAEAVEYSAWLQWLADEQLTALGQQSWRRGVGVGLYQDLAVGVNPGGSEAWAWQGAFAGAAYVGAPPDEFNPVGQDWGLPPLVPHRLREAAYAPFIAMLRANMRHCGALRIDHVMGLARLFWVPVGRPATEGAYVNYPLADLLAIVALESQRNRCMVIGEDLGTVPDGFRPRLATAGVLSYRPFLFERSEDGNFKPPAEYPRQALVAVSTHDLPTLKGFWKGHDIDTRAALQLFPDEAQFDHMVVERAQDRARFLMALKHADLLPEGASVHPFSVPEITQPFVVAIHAFLARTPAQLLVVQPEDILGAVEQANLPGSRDDQHPNWRRRLPLDLEDWPEDGRFGAVGEQLINERGTAVVPPEEIGDAFAGNDHPARDLPHAVQSRLHLCPGRGAGVLSGGAGHQPLLCLALSAGATRQHARLRHRRPRRTQSGNRHHSGIRGLRRRPQGERPVAGH
jgi:(1->4)-alpha-D-glucan 1-alpha-D-glucosylmutase